MTAEGGPPRIQGRRRSAGRPRRRPPSRRPDGAEAIRAAASAAREDTPQEALLPEDDPREPPLHDPPSGRRRAGAGSKSRAPGFDPQRTLGEWLEGLIPPEAQIHFIAAGREFATGVQMTLDHHINRNRPEPESRSFRIEIE